MTVTIMLDGVAVVVPSGTSVAAAIMNRGESIRRSVAGEPRAAVCGMGVCQECRATIDGVSSRRTCMVSVADGMKVTRELDR